MARPLGHIRDQRSRAVTPYRHRWILAIAAAMGFVASTGNACGGDANDPSAGGALHAVVSGLSPSATNGGQLSVTALDATGFGPPAIRLPADGDSIVPDVPPGRYRLSLVPPTGYSLPVGEASAKDTTVRAGEEVTVGWTVVPGEATIRVAVSGLAPGVQDGGSAVIVRVDISSQLPVVVSISGTGAGELGVLQGTYRITFTPPPGYGVDQSVQNPQTVTTTVGAVAVAAFAVGPSSGFQTPDILSNGSFESDWDGFTNGGGSDPTGVGRDNTRAFDGSIAIKRTLPVTGGSDIGAAFYLPYYASAGTFDRVWGRFYFYLDAAIDGTLKFQIWESAGFNTQFGGFYLAGGALVWAFFPEWGGQFMSLAELGGLTKGWHSLECDYWRNGDPSGYPSVAIWLDGAQLSGGRGSPPAPGYWSGSRLYAGQRQSAEQLGTYNLVGVLNGTPGNTVAGNVWVDRVSVSTIGRIGQ